MKGFEQPESRQILESAALSIPDGKWMAHAAAASLSLAPQDDPDKRQRHSPRLVRL